MYYYERIRTKQGDAMKKRKWYSSMLVYLPFSFFLFFVPVSLYSSQLFHTIQVGSFPDVDSAQKQFDEIVETLNPEELDNLRVEKIGGFYSVRLGKFNNSPEAEKSLRNIRSGLPRAQVMTAYIKDERIIRVYKNRAGSALEEGKVPSLPGPVPDRGIPAPAERNESKDKPLSLKENILRIAALVENNDFNSARDIIEKEIAVQPEHPDLNAWYGMVLLKMDRPLEALKYLKKAVELSPDISDYHNALAYALFFLKRFDRAVDEFNKVIHLDPVHVDALTGLCIVYTAKGEKEKAIEMYKKIKDVDQETSDKLLKLMGI